MDVIVCMPGYKPNHDLLYGFLVKYTVVGQAPDSMTTRDKA